MTKHLHIVRHEEIFASETKMDQIERGQFK